MERLKIIFAFLGLFSFVIIKATAGIIDLNIVGYMPYNEGGQWFVGCLFEASKKEINIQVVTVSLYKKDINNEEVLIFKKKNEGLIRVEKGNILNKNFLIDTALKNDFILPIYLNKLFSKCGVLLPGDYKMSVEVVGDTSTIQKLFYFDIDTQISVNTNLRRDLTSLFAKKRNRKYADNLQKMINFNKNKLKKIDVKYGIKHKVDFNNGKIILHYYYNEMYVGNYIIDLNLPIEYNYGNPYDNFNTAIKNSSKLNLDPLFNEFININRQNKEDQILTGNINLSSFASNEKDELSGIDNKYLDIQGDLSFPVFDVPIQVSGYYTTQDKNRPVKSSFINIKYDHNAAKEKAIKMLTAFKSTYGASEVQLQKYKMTYTSFISSSKMKSEKLYESLYKKYGSDLINSYISNSKEVVIGQIKDELLMSMNHLDSSDLVNQAENEYKELEEKYKKYQNLTNKVEEYSAKLEQLKGNLSIDSALVISKISELNEYSEMSNKDLLRAASALIPDSKAKKVLGGLTSLEGGIFNKYVSKYTLAGQSIKGVDIGYDILFAEVAGTYGNTEYIDRLGNIEQYKTISVRLNTKEFLNQKSSLSYNTITPSKIIVENNEFLNNGKVLIPSFLNSVNIYSLQHNGTFFSDLLTVNIDAAYSDVQGQSQESKNRLKFKDQLAALGELLFQMPNSDFSIIATYENVGSDFNNNALPVSFSGIERVSTKLNGSIMKSKIFMGVSYNYLIQDNLYSKGKQARYGFDVKTNFRKIPNFFISYKPYTTIRNPYDTLSIQQKAIVGDLVIGRINYQYKNRNQTIFRTAFIFNRSRSYIDTSDFQNTLLQGTFSFSKPLWALYTNLGYSNYQSNYLNTEYPIYNKILFLMTQIQYKITTSINTSMGIEISQTRLGISRVGWNSSLSYRLSNVPLNFRLTARYNAYLLEAHIPWKNLYGIGLDISYNLFEKLN